jgi:hypothetical protein
MHVSMVLLLLENTFELFDIIPYVILMNKFMEMIIARRFKQNRLSGLFYKYIILMIGLYQSHLYLTISQTFR